MIIEHKRPELPPSTPPEIAQLAADCWHQSADARPSFEQVVVRLQQALERSSQLVSQTVSDQFVADF